MPPVPPTQSGGRGRRRGLVIGGVVGVLALGGAAFGAYSWFSSTGAQPAEALPAGTLGYLSVDLDPSGSQKIEALKTLRKFPAFKDQVNLGTDDDLREKIVEEALKDAPCDGLDYADDIEPWLGDRFAVAAVSQGDDETPAPVFVAQVTDADQAEKGLQAIRECADPESSDDLGGWSVSGDWVVVAETEDIAQQVTDDADGGSLADDADFQKWTDAAGDPGVISAYASPEAGKVLGSQLGDLGALGGGLVAEANPAQVPDASAAVEDCFDLDPVDDAEAFQACLEAASSPTEELSPLPAPEVDQEAVTSMFEDFGGAGLNIRFDDGSLEVEVAADGSFAGLGSLTTSDHGGDVLATLPEDTAAAFGVGFESGWFEDVLGYVNDLSGGELDLDAQLADLEAETGLSFPDDVETLLGESAAVAVSSDFDPEVIFNSESGLSQVPVGAKIKGDPEAIQEVLDKITATAPSPDDAAFLASDAEGDHLVIGPNSDYRAQLLEDGGLGDSDVYQDVVREDRASSIFFVNFDAGDGWLANLAGEDADIKENLEPLSGLGFSGWSDDEVNHSMLRITTD